MFDKIVVVTRKTRLQELIERFNTRSQAQFYIEHAGGDFSDYLQEEHTYQHSLEQACHTLEMGLPVQVIDRSFLPTFLFSDKDLVVALGQDGLVANCAKYVGSQPIVAVNPDVARFDGILLPFKVGQIKKAVTAVLENKARLREVTLAEARLNDGQCLLAFNDLFIGAHTHISARYRIQLGQQSEPHSSSGLLVATGAGSTGWLSSVFNMVAGIARAMGGTFEQKVQMCWEDDFLTFVVREPFISKYSRANLISGQIRQGQELVLESLMPTGGVIFSDGIMEDYLGFNSGSIARIGVADQRARLVVGE